MFFNITTKELDNFPIKYRHGNLVLNLDSGWSESFDNNNNKIFYKGYLDQGPIAEYIEEIACQEEPIYTGNFCILKCFDQGVTIKTDRCRSFPIWYDAVQGCNNLIPYSYTCWTDSFVTITHTLVMHKLYSCMTGAHKAFRIQTSTLTLKASTFKACSKRQRCSRQMNRNF